MKTAKARGELALGKYHKKTTSRSPSTEAGEGRREADIAVPGRGVKPATNLTEWSEPVSTWDHLFAE